MQEIGNHSESVFLMFIFSNCNLKCLSPRCHYGHCQIMDEMHEYVCCKEVDEILSLCLQMVTEGEAAKAPQCIADHHGFLAVCTNKYVLGTAWFQYKQHYKDSYEGPEHKQIRHTAYRQMARWGAGVLGREVYHNINCILYDFKILIRLFILL